VRDERYRVLSEAHGDIDEEEMSGCSTTYHGPSCSLQDGVDIATVPAVVVGVERLAIFVVVVRNIRVDKCSERRDYKSV
jgi:hypothetical protein